MKTKDHPCNCKNCDNDSCRFNYKNIPNDDDDCRTVPYDTIFIWNHTRVYGCCSNPKYQALMAKNLTSIFDKHIKQTVESGVLLHGEQEIVDTLKWVNNVINNTDFAEVNKV